MASERQQNFLGQQRVDVPHLRALESGVANDFDTLAGIMIAGKVPIIVTGFELVTTDIVGSDADTIQLNTAGGSLIHYYATEAGSILKIPDDRAVEVLEAINTRVQGGFTPSTTNYIGIDLLRSADDSTSDIVQFINPDTNLEIPTEVPLARVLDYKIVISTADFSSTPNVCPIAKVVTDGSNIVVSVEDARNLLFRLGVGGSQPSAISPFSWPGGRSEASPLLATIAGDRSIFSMKEWMNATMTRIWEIGGGEYWYSVNADRNIFFGNQGAPIVGDEHYEISSGHLHWKGAFFSFDNSTGTINEIADQLTDLPGLTDLAVGDCLYVDLDRTQDKTGLNALVAKKAPLAVVGASTRPGQRWTFVVRSAAGYIVRGRHSPVGSIPGAPIATSAVHGITRLSGQPTALPGVAYVPSIVSLSTGIATAGGISHNVDLLSATNLTAGNVVVGRGEAAGDHNVLVTTTGATRQTVISGEGTGAVAAAVVQNPTTNHNSSPTSKILKVRSYGGTDIETALFVEGIGAVGLRNIDGNVTPATPAPTSDEDVRSKLFMRHNGVASPNRRDQFCIIWHDGTVSVIFEGPLY